MEQNNFSVSLIIPCYNEEVNIQKGVLDKIGNYTKDRDIFVEVMIVDDGSNDRSKKIIKEKYLPNFPKFKLFENQHMGKAFAIIAGIKHAQGDFVLFSDIDLATPIEESEKLINEAKKGNHIIIGSRTMNREGAPLMRKIMAWGFITLRNLIIGLKRIRDTQCGFKMFRRDTALEVIKHLYVFKKKRAAQGSSVTAGFDLEFLFLAAKFGYKIKEIQVVWKHVETKNVHFVKDAFETLKDIATIKFADISGKYKI